MTIAEDLLEFRLSAVEIRLLLVQLQEDRRFVDIGERFSICPVAGASRGTGALELRLLIDLLTLQRHQLVFEIGQTLVSYRFGVRICGRKIVLDTELSCGLFG